MHYVVIVIISSIVYAVVQAGASALLLPSITGLARRGDYFKQFLSLAVVTLTFIFFLQGIFLVYQCRLEKIVYKLFGVTAPTCAHFFGPLFLTHATLPAIIFFYVAAIVITYLLIEQTYHLPTEKVLTMLLVTNAVACVAKALSVAYLL